MSNEYLRAAKNLKGMARLVTNYSRIKELEARGISARETAQIFDLDPDKLENFVEISDGFVSGELKLTLDIEFASKKAFTDTANGLA